jgi:TetR/AcrR family transcriptional regulator
LLIPPKLHFFYTDRYNDGVTVPETAQARIKASSLQLFVERGYEAVGVQELCDSSGVTKPTLYHHFGSKRGLLDSLCLDLRDVLAPAVDSIGVLRDLTSVLTQLSEQLFLVASREPLWFRLLLLFYNAPSASPLRAAGTGIQALLRSRLETLFSDASVLHGNMRGREQAYTVSLLGTLFAYGSLLADGEMEWNADLPYRVIHQFSHGVYS